MFSYKFAAYLHNTSGWLLLETSDKSPGNDGPTAGFYKHFSNELAPPILDVYDSRGKIGTIGVTSRTRIISVKYKKGDKNER